jgi:pSer/pThr/pTyr-binding forkhead associated (FHA) protein
MRSRILIGLIAGTLGGFLGWMLQEALINYNAHIIASALPGKAAIKAPLSGGETRMLMLCVGGLIGLFLGSVDGILEGNGRKLWQGAFIGAVAGFLLGSVGYLLGSQLFGALGGSDDGASPGIGSFARQIIARAFGWALMGLGLGTGSALSSRSPKRIWHGAIGGFIGGFLGGFVFDLVSTGAAPVQGALSTGPRDVGGPGRAIGFTAIGGLTGFFIGLVDELLKEAWVKVLAGRNEGKDFILSKAVSILGRDERCDVPLFGDVAVAGQHAAIRSDGRRHVLIDAGTPAGTLVNGQRLDKGAELLLRDGDMIQIGMQRVLFHERATAKRVSAGPVDAPRTRPVGPANTPIPSHLCPFCGGTKDAAGNCLCSVGGAPGAAASSPAYASGGMPSYGAGNQTPIPVGLGTAPASYGVAATLAPPIGQLVGLEGAVMGQVFALTGPNTVIGREAGKDIVITGDATVSRTHARIAAENGVYTVYDNGSANGTFVNGQRIGQQALAPGDIVQFGASKFRFE